MTHGWTGDRHRIAVAVTVALAVTGVVLLGVGLAGQREVPRLPTAVAAAPPAPSPGPAAGPPEHGLTLPASEPVSVAIPSIDVGSPMLVPLGLAPDGSMEVPSNFDLAGWYRAGPTPGEPGPAVIVGHVDSAEDGPAVFFRLTELRPGARVHVTRTDGRTAVFAVNRVVSYPKDEFPTREVYGATYRAELRLITCGGSFDEASGDYRDNIVAFAHLVGVRDTRVGTSGSKAAPRPEGPQ